MTPLELISKHPNWEDEKQTNEEQSVLNKIKSELLPPVIKLTSANVTLKDKSNLKGLENILDANPSTIWSASKSGLATLININLGKKTTLQGSKIVWEKDSDWYTYSLEVSENGTEWTTAIKEIKVSGQDYKPLLYNYKNIQYLRLTVSEVQPENSKVAIKDIEL